MQTEATRRERRAASRSHAISCSSRAASLDAEAAGDDQRVDRAAAVLERSIGHELDAARGAERSPRGDTSSRSYAPAVRRAVRRARRPRRVPSRRAPARRGKRRRRCVCGCSRGDDEAAAALAAMTCTGRFLPARYLGDRGACRARGSGPSGLREARTRAASAAPSRRASRGWAALRAGWRRRTGRRTSRTRSSRSCSSSQ